MARDRLQPHIEDLVSLAHLSSLWSHGERFINKIIMEISGGIREMMEKETCLNGEH